MVEATVGNSLGKHLRTDYNDHQINREHTGRNPEQGNKGTHKGKPQIMEGNAQRSHKERARERTRAVTQKKRHERNAQAKKRAEKRTRRGAWKRA